MTGKKMASRFRRFFGRFLALFKKHGRHSQKKNSGLPEHPVADLTSKTSLINEIKLLENNEEAEVVLTKTEHLVDEVKVEVNSVTTDVEEKEQTDLKAENVSASKEELEPKVVKTWAEEVDETEALGLDVFAETSGTANVTPVAVIHSGITASTAAASTLSNTKAAKRRRARRVAAAAARRESQVVATNQDAAARDYDQRVMQRQQRDMVPAEVPYRRPTRPSPSVRVFGRDGRPLVCQWEDGYAAFHAQRHTQAKAGH